MKYPRESRTETPGNEQNCDETPHANAPSQSGCRKLKEKVTQKEETAKNLLRRRPEAVIERAVKGMLPKNRLGRKMYKKLFVYAGAQHPHTAQQPKTLTF